MRVELKRVNDSFHFKGIGSAGVEINLDTTPEFGGHNEGARPMEMVLMALGFCSSIDVIQILKKQKQSIDDFKVVINGERDPNNIPSLFTDIHIQFILKGRLENSKVERAVKLSIEKYCSVAAILRHTAKISHEHKIET